MLILYRKRILGNVSDVKVEEWLRGHKICYRVVTPKDINYEIVQKMLATSEKGFEDILTSRKKAKKTWQKVGLGISEKNFNSMTTHNLITFITNNPCLLKSPIIFDDKYLMSGFNSDQIRVFIPKKQRFIHKLMLKENKF